MDVGLVGIIVQAGAVGLAAICLWILYKVLMYLMPELRALAATIAVLTDLARNLVELVKDLKNSIDSLDIHHRRGDHP